MKTYILLICSILCTINVSAQTNKYQYIDDAVAKIGALPTLNVANITEAITAKYSESEDKARAIYYWIANNIQIDATATKKLDQRNIDPEKVILSRKATPLGFSLLFQEMCSSVKIRCLSVDGYVKNYASEINEKADEKNHSWNVVQLGTSPNTWYYVDACRASGYLDVKQTIFTKSFTSQYFFADKKLFNLMYYPDNMAWQLGDANTKSLNGFYALPVLANYAMALEVKNPLPLTGYIKTKIGVKINFSFGINSDNTINKISLITGDIKKKGTEIPMNFDVSNGQVTFSYDFKKEDIFPLKIIADDKIVFEYMVEVLEK